MPANQRAAIVFAAAPVEPIARLRARLGELTHPFVVAADGGAATALAFAYQPDVVIGDLDSIDSGTLTELRRRGVAIDTFPRDKDATDGQLALDRALHIRPAQLLLLGFLGGPRLDQALANVVLLVTLQTPAVLLDERNECVLVRPGVEYSWRTEPSEIISVLPLNGDAQGVSSRGLRWPLTGETLRLGDTRSLSNEPVAKDAGVAIERGLVLVTRHFPDA